MDKSLRQLHEALRATVDTTVWQAAQRSHMGQVPIAQDGGSLQFFNEYTQQLRQMRQRRFGPDLQRYSFDSAVNK